MTFNYWRGTTDMADPRVFFVHLRRPRAKDQRDDPFYEFGSFGCTGCHSWNLLNHRHASELKGAQLAFIQGGLDGSRLVFLTPPISVKEWPDRCEAKWTPAEMPFKYDKAPIIVRNDGTTDFPLVMKFTLNSRKLTVDGKRISLERRFSSKVRSLTREMEKDIAKEIIAVYRKRRDARTSIASKYHESLPYTKVKDANREDTYQKYIDALEAQTQSRCRAEKVVRKRCREPVRKRCL